MKNRRFVIWAVLSTVGLSPMRSCEADPSLKIKLTPTTVPE